jgi:hypothetical protein
LYVFRALLFCVATHAQPVHFAYFFAQMTPAKGLNDSESGEQLIAQAIRLGESLGKDQAQVPMINLLRCAPLHHRLRMYLIFGQRDDAPSVDVWLAGQ